MQKKKKHNKIFQENRFIYNYKRCVNCSIFLQGFRGNYDIYHIVAQRVSPSIRARYIRIHPKSWRSYIAMRVELYGCRYRGEYDTLYSRIVVTLSRLTFVEYVLPITISKVNHIS